MATLQILLNKYYKKTQISWSIVEQVTCILVLSWARVDDRLVEFTSVLTYD